MRTRFAKLIQQQHRITARLRDPVGVHLHPYQRRISLLQQDVEAGGPLQVLELVVVVVESEAHAMLLALLAPLVEGGGGPAKTFR